MKIRLRYRRAGPDGVHPPGAIIEVDAKKAKHLIATQQADPVEESEPAPEVAIEPPTETAASTSRPVRRKVTPPEEAPPTTEG